MDSNYNCTTYRTVIGEKLEWCSCLNGNPDEEWQTETKVDIKDIGANGVGNSHISKPIPCNKNRTETVL